MKSLKEFTPQNYQKSDKELDLHHIFDEKDIAALWAAYAAARPLLVRGEPGTGKSQMAKAIAVHLDWAFVSHVIRGDTELSDLHWYFDAVARLGEAQAMGHNKNGSSNLDADGFLSPGAFWWAFDWVSANNQHDKCNTQMQSKPYTPGSDKKVKGVVLLIDEIDKANPDLPNGLLETIGNLEFTVPYLNCGAKDRDGQTPTNPISAGSIPLLIVITTNEERELPQAFVRRCFVHTLQMEESELPDEKTPDITKREQWLIDRGRLHFKSAISNDAYENAAKLLWKDRTDTSNKSYPPGLAEYIDLLRVLKEVPRNEQADFIQTIAAYVFEKELKN